MASSLKLQDIDQKIKDLLDRKKYLEQKQVNDFARLLKKVNAHLLPPDVLTGALIDIVQAFNDQNPTIQAWSKKGQDFFTLTSQETRKALSNKGDTQNDNEKESEDQNRNSIDTNHKITDNQADGKGDNRGREQETSPSFRKAQETATSAS